MPAGTPYFAWIDPTETVFGPEHLVWDENIFSFKLSQDEGDPASLTLVVRRPRNISGDPIGLLGPGRKIWCWFAFDCGPALIKFRGRLVGIPTDIFQELVTLDFVARPIDVVAQKEALAETLRVLPYYDPIMIEESRRTDPEVVLEAYTAIWHYDRETHIITISDEITGEDGLVTFDASNAANTVLYDGLGFQLTSGPLARASVTAEFNWTQGSSGTVDLTAYLLSNWPPPVRPPLAVPGAIQLDESDWPKPGASLGNGWTVADSTAENLLDYEVRTETFNSQVTTIFPDGDSVRGTTTTSESKTGTPGNQILVTDLTTNDDVNVQSQPDPDGGTFIASFSRNTTQIRVLVSLQEIKPTLIATYAAGRQMGERVAITLTADVQPILTDPEDGEALQLEDIRSVNLSESIDDVIPMGDPRRQSYIATERGNQSIQYLIMLLKAHLMKRARVVEITFAPKLARMPEITLRKNAFLVEPRVGEATGKIIGYSLALDGSDGRINCEVRIGCTIGNGGSVTVVPGTPVYCSINYVGADYQQFVGRTIIAAPGDTSVTYEPPVPVPDPNAINFLSTLTAADVIEVPLVVQYGAIPPAAEIPPIRPRSEEALETATDFVNAYWIPQYETQATFKLKNVTGDLTADYTIVTSDLKIPLGYNLEAT
jgi:hypothetical protein